MAVNHLQLSARPHFRREGFQKTSIEKMDMFGSALLAGAAFFLFLWPCLFVPAVLAAADECRHALMEEDRQYPHAVKGIQPWLSVGHIRGGGFEPWLLYAGLESGFEGDYFGRARVNNNRRAEDWWFQPQSHCLQLSTDLDGAGLFRICRALLGCVKIVNCAGGCCHRFHFFLKICKAVKLVCSSAGFFSQPRRAPKLVKTAFMDVGVDENYAILFSTHYCSPRDLPSFDGSIIDNLKLRLNLEEMASLRSSRPLDDGCSKI